MPRCFMDIESATDMEAKSKGTPPASRTPAAASRANSPRSALHGVTRPSVDATPTNGLAMSASERPRPRRNARCGARSRPSTVMREGSFFVFTHDLVDRSAVRQAERGRARRVGRLRHGVHKRLQRRIGLEAHATSRMRPHRVPHLLRADWNAGEEHRATLAKLARRQFSYAAQTLHHARYGDACHARVRPHRADVIAAGERLADDGARPPGHGGVRAPWPHHDGGQASRAAIDVAAARILVDQHFANELLRAI